MPSRIRPPRILPIQRLGPDKIWASIEAFMLIIMRGNRHEWDLLDPQLCYHKVYQLCRRPRLTRDSSAEDPSPSVELLEKLGNFVNKYLEEIARQLKHRETDEFLLSYATYFDHFTSAAYEANLILFSYLNRCLEEDGRGVDMVKTLFYRHLDSFVRTVEEKMRKKVQHAVWMAASKNDKEKIEHPAVRQIVINSCDIPRHVTPRRLYLLTCDVRLLGTIARILPVKLLAIRHWALYVEDKPSEGTVYQLTVQNGFARLERKRFSSDERWARRLVGFTVLTDEFINEYAKMVDLMTPKDYSPLFNNCQKLVNHLQQSIRTPINEHDLLEDIKDFSATFNNGILHRRFKEFVGSFYFPECYFPDTGSAEPVTSMPTSITPRLRLIRRRKAYGPNSDTFQLLFEENSSHLLEYC